MVGDLVTVVLVYVSEDDDYEDGGVEYGTLYGEVGDVDDNDSLCEDG